MDNKIRGWLAALLLVCAGVTARADERVVEAYFLNHLPNGSDSDHIESASMDDRVLCIVVHGTELPEGEHEFHMTITDGRNREVFNYRVPIRGVRGVWVQRAWRNYIRAEDAPGTWSFTVEIDGKQVLERDIQIDPPSAK